MSSTLLLIAALVARAPQDFGPRPAATRPAPSKAAASQDAEDAFVEIYDVRDLALPSSRHAPRHDRATETDAPEDGVAWKLLEALVQCVEAGSADAPDPGFHCTSKPNGALVVRARRDAHERVRRLLHALRRPEPQAIKVEIRVFELGREQRDALVELEQVKTDHPELAVALIDRVAPATIDRLVRGGVNLISAPDVVALALQPFELRTGNDCSYVASYDLVSIEGIGRIADPVIKTVHEGLTIQGRVVAAPDSDSKEATFALRLEVESSVLKRPMARMQSDLGEIQLPEVKHVTIATTVAGEVGHSFLVGGVPKPSFDPKDEETRVYLLVTVRAPMTAAADHLPTDERK